MSSRLADTTPKVEHGDPVRVIDRAYLSTHSDELLARGGFSPEQIAQMRADGEVADNGLMLWTTGSTGAPLLVPRTRQDILDIASRGAAPFVRRHGRAPQRVALIGGTSHTRAAMNYQFGSIQMKTIAAGDLAALEAFDPEMMSCFPSAGRAFFFERRPDLPSLKMIKFAGETVLASDVRRVFEVFPDVLLVDQFGSTEMPVLAIKVYAPDGAPTEFVLETRRFSFLLAARDGWQPIVARDNFRPLLFPIEDYYDTGDEGRFVDGRLLEVRRRGDPVTPYRELLEALMDAGATQLQLDPTARVIRYQGTVAGPAFTWQGTRYELEREPPRRLRSGKAPLVLAS